MKMRLDLKRRLQLKEESRKVEQEQTKHNNIDDDWEQDRSHLVIDVNNDIKEDNKMSLELVQGNKDMSDFPSMSNKLKNEEGDVKGMEGKSEDNFELILNKVYPVYRNGRIHKWMTTLNSEQITNLYSNNQIYYDFETQRGFKTSSKGEMKPLLVPRHIEDILKKMASSEIAGGALTLCYFKEYKEDVEYDENRHSILFRNKLAIIDGAHRIFSCIKMTKLHKKDATKPDPTLFEYPIFLEVLTRQEAMALFSEYASAGKRIGKVRVESLNVFDDSHAMANEIIKNSELHNKVERISSSPKENNIMLMSTLMNGVRIFKSKTSEDSKLISQFLSEFWTELIHLYKDEMGNMDFKERKEIRKQTYLLEPMFLMGMFHVAKTLYDSPDNWKDKLKKLKEDSKFFSRDNGLWDSIRRENGATINTSGTQSYIISEMIKKVMS